MSFVPGGGIYSPTSGGGGGSGGITQITAGLGIATNTVGGSTNVATSLTAGNNITLTNTSGNVLQISANGSTGIVSVASNNGSGITATNNSGAVALTTNLLAGSGVSLTPSVVDTSITIATTGVDTVAPGNAGITVGGTATAPTISNAFSVSAGTGGISVSGTQFAPVINDLVNITTANGSGLTNGGKNATTGAIPLAVNLTAGNAGITIVPSVSTTGVAINNAGVLGITSANAGLTLGGTAQNPILTPAVASIVGGTGITTTNVGGTQTITNAGVVGISSANAGTNITITGTPTVPIISASAGSSLTPGTGIAINGGVVSNTGVVSLNTTNGNGNAGVLVGGTATVPVFSNTYSVFGTNNNIGCGITVGAKTNSAGTQFQTLQSALVAGSGITLTPSLTNPNIQIDNAGVRTLTAGTGITITGSGNTPTISAVAGFPGLTSANNGTNISITGTANAPIISAISTGGQNPSSIYDPILQQLTYSPGGDTTSIANFGVKFIGGTVNTATTAGANNWTFTSATTNLPRGGSFVLRYEFSIPLSYWAFSSSQAYLVINIGGSEPVRQTINIGTVGGGTFTWTGKTVNLGLQGVIVGASSTSSAVNATLYITGAVNLATTFGYQGSFGYYYQYISPNTTG